MQYFSQARRRALTDEEIQSLLLDTDSEDFDDSDKDPDFVVPVSNGKDETQITVENGEFEEPCASSAIIIVRARTQNNYTLQKFKIVKIVH